jgi:hypothetical protein
MDPPESGVESTISFYQKVVTAVPIRTNSNKTDNNSNKTDNNNNNNAPTLINSVEVEGGIDNGGSDLVSPSSTISNNNDEDNSIVMGRGDVNFIIERPLQEPEDDENHDELKKLIKKIVQEELTRTNRRSNLMRGLGDESNNRRSDHGVNGVNDGDEEEQGDTPSHRRNSRYSRQSYVNEADTYSLMLVSKSYVSYAFLFSVFVCFMQIVLLVGILSQLIGDGNDRDSKNFWNVPWANDGRVHLGQFVAVIFAVFTQRDLLYSIPMFISLWSYRNVKELRKIVTEADDGVEQVNQVEEERNMSTNSIAFSKDPSSRRFWWEKVFPTYMLRLGVSSFTLFTAFTLIIQSVDLIDLVKDFTALFIIAELDNFSYSVIKDGYFGTIFEEETKHADQVNYQIEKRIYYSPEIRGYRIRIQSLVLLVFVVIMLSTWAYVASYQTSGSYFSELVKTCDVFRSNEDIKYKFWGDGTCDPRLFTEECDYDGGDCNSECSDYLSMNDPQDYRYYFYYDDDTNVGKLHYIQNPFFNDISKKAKSVCEGEDCSGCNLLTTDTWGEFDIKSYDEFSKCFSDEIIYNDLYFCYFAEEIQIGSEIREKTKGDT